MNTLMKQIKITDKSFSEATASSNRNKAISVFDMYGKNSWKAMVGDSKLHDTNFAFFTNTLMNLHKELVEPKHFVSYVYDIPTTYGGGFVDFSTYYTVDWSGLIDTVRAITANNANYLPRINAGMTQEQVPVYTYEVAYDIRFLELEKIKKLELQKSLEDIYENAIVAGWDLFVQEIAYLGKDGREGLFTSSKITPYTIDNNKSDANKGVNKFTDTEIVALFNNIFKTYLVESNSNYTILPDTILVPSFVGEELTSRMSTLYTSTLRQFIAENNLAVHESLGNLERITIATRPQLDTLGTGKHGRIVAYKNDKSFVRLDIPYPIQHFITLPNIEKMAYTTAFVGQVSGVQLPYNKQNEFGVVSYWDFTK